MTHAPRVHGTRAAYQAGCPCGGCRAAEAAYRAAVRAGQRSGKPPLGALVDAADAARRVKALLVERYTQRQIAACAGLQRRTVGRTTALAPRSQIRLTTRLRLRLAYRRLLGPAV